MTGRQDDLANFAMEIGDFIDDDPDFQPEIAQTVLDRAKVLKDYTNSKKNRETVKKNRREAAAM